jgi:peptide/nickel transport system substrate-binding protein
MSSDQSGYWTRLTQRRYSRRSVMRGSLLAGAGVMASTALACKGTTSIGSSKPAAPSQSQSGASATSALAGLDGRSGSQPKGPPVRGGTLNWYLAGNPPNLDPTQNTSTLTIVPAGAVYSRLFRYKTPWDVVQSLNLETAPDIGQTAESPDGLTWTIKLRANAKFQNIPPVNGHAVEAEDVKQSFLKATSPKAVNSGNVAYIDPNQIQTPDKQTVVFKLNYPFALFPSSGLASRYCWIFPREAVSGAYEPATKMIGSGPWMLDTVTPDVAETYKRNPDYYDSSQPYVDSVRVAILPDPNSRIAQFTGGHTDYLMGVLVNDVPTVQQQNPKAEALHVINNANGIMYYNLAQGSGSPFLDIRLRQAASLAIDRDAYAKASGFAPGQYIQTFIVSPGIGKWAAGIEDYPADTQQWYKYDLQRAKQLFAAAGGEKLNMKLIYPAGNPADPQLGVQAQTVFSMLKQLPWNSLTYVTVDYQHDWINGGKGIGYPAGGVPPDSMAWWGPGAVGPTVDEYIVYFYQSKGAGNMSHLDDPKVDSLLVKARGTLKEEDQVTAYKDVQRYIVSQLYAMLGMVNGEGYTFVSPRAQNYALGDNVAVGTANWAQMWLTG